MHKLCSKLVVETNMAMIEQKTRQALAELIAKAKAEMGEICAIEAEMLALEAKMQAKQATGDQR